MKKMIPLIAIFCVTAALAYPKPKEINIPEFNVSSPSEINGLTAEGRSINGITSQNGFDDTIKEVEAILKTNPNLPRLTRGEILDLLDNITQSDVEKAKGTRGQKAIMVVMPYTPESENNLQDFYTKAPVTQIIGNEGEKMTKQTIRRRPTTSSTSTTTSTTQEPVTYRRIPPKKQYLVPKKRTKIEATTPSTTTVKDTEYFSRSTPKYTEYFSRSTPKYTEYYSRPTQEYTEYYSRTTQPKYTEYYTNKPRLTTTTTEQPKTTTYKSRPRGTPLRRRRPTTTKYPNHSYYEEDMIVQENQNQEVYQPLKEQVYFNTKSQQFILEEAVTPKQYVTPVTSSPELVELNIPTHLTDVVKDMHLSDAMDGSIVVPTQKPLPSNLENDAQKIKNLMDSLGIQTPTTTEAPNIENVASNLTPDMKDLLMSFGLIPNPDKGKDIKVEDPAPEKAEINPDSFVGFKPLPEDTNSRSEMDELLASFGLGRSARKAKKQEHKPDNDQINLEAVPDEYKDLLTELGIRQGRKIESSSMVKTQEKNSATEKHSFNPVDSQYASEEEMDKLGRLIKMVKELESLNRTITDEDLKKIDLETLKELTQSVHQQESELTPLNQQNSSLNPVNFDYGLSKNEVKRQEPSSTTEESKTPSIKDLEDSFGGETTTTTTTEPPPPPKRTGAYFLVDWNTFLDIDDQKGKRVNLRFQPTVGDPKRFYSVAVP